MPAAAKAQIKRATIRAHRAVEALDSAAMKQIGVAYRTAADDIARRIKDYAGADDTLGLHDLRSVLAQVEARLRDLSDARNALIIGSLERAAELGAEPFFDSAASSDVMRASSDALRFVRNFVAEDGLQLSDRIWRLDRGARDAVVNTIEQAVIQGHGAVEAAREFLGRGERVPSDVQAKLDSANAPRVARAAADQLLTGTGTPMTNAVRLLRTEINRAHGEAYMMSGAGHPDFAGWRFLLSPAHPRPDICDLLARQNLYGLGNGVYPSRAKCPWPAHPNTLSFLEIVFKDEITDQDRCGKQTPAEALAQLMPEERVGALGKGKAEIYDEGKLRQGMIRSRLQDVETRLERKVDVDLRDELTKQHFNGKVTVDTGGYVFDLNGRDLTDQDFARLSGAPDGSHVIVRLEDDSLAIRVSNLDIFQGGLAEFSLIRQAGPDESLLLDEVIMLNPGQPEGFGLRLFATQAIGAAEVGINTIALDAAGSARSTIFNGYYTWPRYGFNAELSPQERAILPAGIDTSQTVGDLFDSQEGRRWWKTHGSGRPMEFDLSEGSRSWETLKAVMKEKGVKL